MPIPKAGEVAHFILDMSLVSCVHKQNQTKGLGLVAPQLRETACQMGRMERLWLWIVPSLFISMCFWSFEGCLVISADPTTHPAARTRPWWGWSAAPPRGTAFCPTTEQAINFLLLVTITQHVLKNNPKLVLPPKEFEPVMKFRGETFSQTAHPKPSISVLVSCSCFWEQQLLRLVGLSWDTGARSAIPGSTIQQDLP